MEGEVEDTGQVSVCQGSGAQADEVSEVIENTCVGHLSDAVTPRINAVLAGTGGVTSGSGSLPLAV